jgi:hypothetical protein
VSHTDDLNGMETESGAECVHELGDCLGGGRGLDLQYSLVGQSRPLLPVLLG